MVSLLKQSDSKWFPQRPPPQRFLLRMGHQLCDHGWLSTESLSWWLSLFPHSLWCSNREFTQQVPLHLDFDFTTVSHSIAPTEHASGDYDGKELEHSQNFSPSPPIISNLHPLLGKSLPNLPNEGFPSSSDFLHLCIHISHTVLYDVVIMRAQGSRTLQGFWGEIIAGLACMEDKPLRFFLNTPPCWISGSFLCTLRLYLLTSYHFLFPTSCFMQISFSFCSSKKKWEGGNISGV